MKRLALILLLVCNLFATAADLCTVTGTLRNRFGVVSRTDVMFKPLDGITFSTPYTQPSWIVKTNSATDGTFTVSLVPGAYQVIVGSEAADKFYIQVPTNAGPYDLASLTTNSPTSLWSYTSNRVFTGATATNAGAVGLVPAPAAGDQTNYLRGDGTWAINSAGQNDEAAAYVRPTFLNSTNTLLIQYSLDGKNWVSITADELPVWTNTIEVGTGVTLRDPTLRYDESLGKFLVAFTHRYTGSKDDPNGQTKYLGLIASSNLLDWAPVGTGLVPCLTTNGDVWAPEWFGDGGTNWLVYTINYLIGQAQTHAVQALDLTFTNWSTNRLVIDAGYDATLNKIGSTFFLLLNNDSLNVQWWSNRSGIFSTWYNAGSGPTPAGTNMVEGQQLLRWGDGWRIYISSYDHGLFWYTNSSDPLALRGAVTETVLVEIPTNTISHATIFPVTGVAKTRLLAALGNRATGTNIVLKGSLSADRFYGDGTGLTNVAGTGSSTSAVNFAVSNVLSVDVIRSLTNGAIELGSANGTRLGGGLDGGWTNAIIGNGGWLTNYSGNQISDGFGMLPWSLNKTRVVADGDSMTRGYNASPGWFRMWWNIYGSNANIVWLTNASWIATPIYDFDADEGTYKTYTNNLQPFKPAEGTNGVFFYFGGTLDVENNDLETAWSHFSNQWRVVKQDGWTLVAFTVSGKSNWTTLQKTVLTNINARIRAASTNWDYLVDAQQLWGNLADTNCFDGVHWNTNACCAMARLVQQSLVTQSPYYSSNRVFGSYRELRADTARLTNASITTLAAETGFVTNVSFWSDSEGKWLYYDDDIKTPMFGSVLTGGGGNILTRDGAGKLLDSSTTVESLLPRANSYATNLAVTNMTITGPLLIYGDNYRTNGFYQDASGKWMTNLIGGVKISGGGLITSNSTSGNMTWLTNGSLSLSNYSATKTNSSWTNYLDGDRLVLGPVYMPSSGAGSKDGFQSLVVNSNILVVTSNRVGIGKLNPGAYALDVVGSVNISAGLTTGSDITSGGDVVTPATGTYSLRGGSGGYIGWASRLALRSINSSTIVFGTQSSNTPAFRVNSTTNLIWFTDGSNGLAGCGIVLDKLGQDPTPYESTTNTLVYSQGTNLVISDPLIVSGANGFSKVLTNNVATTVMTILCATNSWQSGVAHYTIESSAGGEYSTHTATLRWAVTSKGGVIAGTVTEGVETETHTAGAALSDAWTIAGTSSTNATISLNAYHATISTHLLRIGSIEHLGTNKPPLSFNNAW